MRKFPLAIIITTSVLILTVAVGYMALVSNPVLVPVYFSVLTGMATVYLAQMLIESNEDRQTKKLLDAARLVLLEELRRDFCTAEVFLSSLLPTKAWESVVESGLALKFDEHEFKPLLECYSPIGFYNYDVSKGNLGEKKLERVEKRISEALSAIKGRTPTLEQCCEEILPEWATPEKPSEHCIRRRHQLQEDSKER